MVSNRYRRQCRRCHRHRRHHRSHNDTSKCKVQSTNVPLLYIRKRSTQFCSIPLYFEWLDWVCVCVCSTRLLCTHTQHAKWLARPEPHTLIKHMWSIVCCDAHAKRSKYHSNGWFFFYFVIFLKFSTLILCQIALIETHIQYIYIYISGFGHTRQSVSLRCTTEAYQTYFNIQRRYSIVWSPSERFFFVFVAVEA